MTEEKCETTLIKGTLKTEKMANASLRFYIDGGILQCEEFKAQLTKGASCDRNVAGNHVSFSDDFLHLLPSSCLSDELITYLNQKTTKVTLLVNRVKTAKVIEGLRPKDGTDVANAAKEFALRFGDKKICGINSSNGSFDIMCEAKSSEKVFELFQTFAPGFFPQVSVPFNKCLRGMRFLDKVKFVFGM